MTLPPDKLAKAERLVASGWTVQGAAVHLRVPYAALFAAMRDVLGRRIARKRAERRRRLAAIAVAESARDLTGRLLGDPPAGRSALDREHAGRSAWPAVSLPPLRCLESGP